MSLAVLSLISTIKIFSSVRPWSDHVLIFIHPPRADRVGQELGASWMKEGCLCTPTLLVPVFPKCARRALGKEPQGSLDACFSSLWLVLWDEVKTVPHPEFSWHILLSCKHYPGRPWELKALPRPQAKQGFEVAVGSAEVIQ